MTNEEYKKWQQSGRRTGVKAFYDTPAWRKLSKAYRAQFPFCQLNRTEGCTQDVPRLTETVDHWIPARVDSSKALDWDNLRSACRQCNSSKQAEDYKRWPVRHGQATPLVPTSGPLTF